MGELHLGDCIEQLRLMPENSVDSIVTDPPAGISFMGKAWDDDKGGRKQWIAWMQEVMSECVRVLKPGGHALVWAIPRTSHWTATAIEEAGFEVRDVVTHLFGSGFPKSLDISKAIDKAAGAEGPVIGKNPAYRERQMEHDAKWETAMRPEFKRAPATDEAKQWQGFGTALKPASEHWILARKPLSEKTVAANVLKWGTGGLNIDASRIGTSDRISESKNKNMTSGGYNLIREKHADSVYKPNTQGRFPANLVFSHSYYCTDIQCDIECVIQALDEQSGFLHGAGNKKTRIAGEGKDSASMFGVEGGAPTVLYDRGGSASRFFYCAKISTRERNAGCEELQDKTMAMSGGAKAAAERGEEYDGNSGMNRTRIVKNSHPTVKPKKLMAYLINLVTPPGGTVLDPFMGSGSTGIAAKENGFKFIGIEKEAEYLEIARARIEHVTV